jgi:catechol 2,3-dioxygenase-like lactoylglutathione lyase family enzyme
MAATNDNEPLPRVEGVLETVLYATDLGKAEAFYTGLLGLDLHAKEEGRHLFYRCGGQMLLIFNPESTSVPSANSRLPIPPHGTHGPGHACFRGSRENILAWRKRLQNDGVEIEAEFEWPQGGLSIYFRDPAGNCLEIAEPRIWNLE